MARPIIFSLLNQTYVPAQALGTAFEPGRCRMKGYNTQNGYMGFVGDRYMLFVNESEYLDYMRSVNE